MKPLSERELRMNQQAAMAAAAVLSEPVEAATRCEQVSQDMRREASGFGGIMRGMMRVNDAMGRATPGTIGRMSTQIETAGLPNSFILAVTRSQVIAIEERQQGDDLVAGRVLKSWDRAGFAARRDNDRANAYRGVPEDRQVLILFLPIEGGRNRYLQAAGPQYRRRGLTWIPASDDGRQRRAQSAGHRRAGRHRRWCGTPASSAVGRAAPAGPGDTARVRRDHRRRIRGQAATDHRGAISIE